MRKTIDEIYHILTKNKLVVIVIIILGIVSGTYSFFRRSNNHSLNVDYSLGSINTVNQSGGTNLIKNQFPPPKLNYETLFLNKAESGKYSSKFSAEIISTPGIPLPKLAVTPEIIGRHCQLEKKPNGEAIKLLQGVMYSSLSFFINCLTDDPLLENQLKFSLITK